MKLHIKLNKNTIEELNNTDVMLREYLSTNLFIKSKIEIEYVVFGDIDYKDTITLKLHLSETIDNLIQSVINHFIEDAAMCISEEDAFEAAIEIEITGIL